MKRGHETTEDYIKWLKSLGCISYCPLNNDLEDKISGASYEYTGSGSYTFENGWLKVTTPSTKIATTLQITIPNFQSLLRPGMTILGELINLGIGYCRPTLFSNIAINSEASPQWHANFIRSSINSPVGEICKSARINNYEERSVSIYTDGLLTVDSFTYDLTTMPSPQNKGMLIGCAGHNNYRNCTFKMRNLMVFNKCLTVEEIRKIQGYE